ncbi:unnamed protein product [Tilletia laevis]|uniref:DDE Tnp4 domain-containing protein n=1 Tax=Tilletia laevis TaxID=157183 RepID=A0A9N8QFA4_9BASI|nr:hypothetical protein CF336_g4739 [Tilletia laevis]CAD6915720.1 unnamed protein product [Tilletia caries]CAD6939117.1 unnamed protein product [Tilletia laevis]CAD6964185.1 unnamed protein product [Tilletia laevis]
MPHISQRAQLIKVLGRHLRHLDSAAAIDEEVIEEADEVADALGVVESNRYLSLERAPNEQRTRNAYTRCEENLAWNDDDFRRAFRVTHAQFEQLLVLLEEDEVFRNKRRGRKQFPPQHQLLLVLWRLAYSGTGATAFLIAERFGVSEGSVITFTDRVLSALIGVESRFVWWPAREERQQMRQEMSDHHGLAGCVGFVDGTHVNLAGTPARLDAADFFNRHHCHSFNVLAVSDSNLRIRFLHLGFPGSAHDQRVYRACGHARWRRRLTITSP